MTPFFFFSEWIIKKENKTISCTGSRLCSHRIRKDFFRLGKNHWGGYKRTLHCSFPVTQPRSTSCCSFINRVASTWQPNVSLQNQYQTFWLLCEDCQVSVSIYGQNWSAKGQAKHCRVRWLLGDIIKPSVVLLKFEFN